jgi:hypothetical protein
MAIQSACLLSEQLIARKDAVLQRPATHAIARSYAASWKLNFVPRIRAAAVYAHLAMRPVVAELALPLLKRLPAVLTFGAYLSGKTQALRSGSL